MTERLEEIKTKFESINREEQEYVAKLENLVQPIALAVKKLMYRKGKDRGRFFNKRRELTFDKFLLTQKRTICGLSDLSIYYNGDLVMKFDDWFSMVSNFTNTKKQYLFFFHEGPWMTKLIKEYYRVMLEVLKENFNMNGEE